MKEQMSEIFQPEENRGDDHDVEDKMELVKCTELKATKMKIVELSNTNEERLFWKQLSRGIRFFNKMQFQNGIKPTLQHYGCMVDLLARVRKINETFDLIKSMRVRMKPNDVLCRSLLSCCKVSFQHRSSRNSSQKSPPMNCKTAGDYLLLTNLYTKAQERDEMAGTRTELVTHGYRQDPGHSSVEVDRKAYKFPAQNISQRFIYDEIWIFENASELV